MSKITKQSVLDNAYNRERARIRQFLNRAGKRGYIFQEGLLPDKPKRVTEASVNRLRQITPEYMYRRSMAKSVLTGEWVPGLVAREHERILAGRKGAAIKKGKIIIKNIRKMIREWEGRANWSAWLKGEVLVDAMVLTSILDGAIERDGLNEVALRCEKNSGVIYDIVERILYSSDRDQASYELSRFAGIVNGRGLTVQESITLTEMAEGLM